MSELIRASCVKARLEVELFSVFCTIYYIMYTVLFLLCRYDVKTDDRDGYGGRAGLSGAFHRRGL